MLSREEFACIFRDQLEVRLVVDPGGTVIQATTGYLHASGLKAEAVLGREMWSCPPFAGDAHLAAQARSLMETSLRLRLPQAVSLTRDEGTPGRWGHLEALPVCVEGARVRFQVLTLQPHRAASLEEAARARRLSKLIEHSYDALALFDNRGNALYASPSFRHLLGLDSAAAHPPVTFSHMHPDDLVDFAAKLSDLYLRPGGSFLTRIRVPDGEGGFRVVELRNRNLLDDPDVAALVSHARDITDDVALHDELRRAQERVTLALSAAHALSWDIDLIGGKHHFSEDLRGYFGITEEALEQEGPIAAVHPDSREEFVRLSRISRQGLGDLNTEFRGRDRDGEERWYASFGRALRDEEGKPIRLAGVTWDITEQRKLRLERAVLDQRMRESQKLESLGVLAGGIAHDFNNLLTAILGHACLARAHPAAAAVRHHLENIEEASQRASDLCRQMLAYAGKAKFVLGVTNLNRLIEDTVHLLKVSISKKVQLTFTLADDLPNIVGDATQLRQVLMNLVLNASEAVGDASGTIAIRTGVMSHEDIKLTELSSGHLEPGDYAFLEVEDSGIGMPEETRARIFDPFFSTKFTGRGLGLSAVLGIVRGHQGALQVRSTPGQGSCFTMLIPVAPNAALENVLPAPMEGPPRYEGTVLLAEDEPAVRTVTKHMLEHLGFSVLTVSDGQAAIAAYREHIAALSLVLMDLTMPRLDGREALSVMRSYGARLPHVILMSGHSEQDVMAHFSDVAAVSFLQKPFTPERLHEEIARAWQGPRTA